MLRRALGTALVDVLIYALDGYQFFRVEERKTEVARGCALIALRGPENLVWCPSGYRAQQRLRSAGVRAAFSESRREVKGPRETRSKSREYIARQRALQRQRKQCQKRRAGKSEISWLLKGTKMEVCGGDGAD